MPVRIKVEEVGGERQVEEEVAVAPGGEEPREVPPKDVVHEQSPMLALTGRDVFFFFSRRLF